VCSAAAKAGKSVLHLDHEEFYGSQARRVREESAEAAARIPFCASLGA
jgi:RAB protein geranylgeranyltransferase component A